MLEIYAYRLMSLDEITLMLVSLGLICVGLIAGLLLRTGSELAIRRVPYLIWSGAAYLVLATVPLVWLLTYAAMDRQMLWGIVAIAFGAMFLYGVVNGVLAHARSVSAYGNGRRGIYALIPFVNLILLFKRPLDAVRGGFRDMLRNILGVTAGLMLMGLGGVMDFLVAEQTDALALEAEFDEGLQATSVGARVKALGLEEALRQIAQETPGHQVDEITHLMGVRSKGEVLQYTYQVETDELSLPEHLRQDIARQTCDNAPLYMVIRAGATIEDIYLRDDGLELGTVRVTRASCSF